MILLCDTSEKKESANSGDGKREFKPCPASDRSACQGAEAPFRVQDIYFLHAHQEI